MAKKQYSPTPVDFVNIDGVYYAQTTKKDNLINITSRMNNVFVKASKGTDAINFEGLNSVADLKDDSKIKFTHVTGTKNLKIELLDNQGKVSQTVTIENFYKKTDGKTTASSLKKVKLVGENSAVQYISIIDEGLIDYESVIKANSKGKVTGTTFNDTIDMHEQTKKLTINGGYGNDVITGGKGNDTITGGKGNNTFIYNEGSGADTIKLTKGEKLTIKYITSATDPQFSIVEKGKNVVITRSYTKDGIPMTDTMTLKNMTKNNLAESVVFMAGADKDSATQVFDIKNDYYIIDNNKKKVTGTNLNEMIYGTTLNDTIKGGGGNDIIDANTGNDKLYGGAGADTFVFGIYELNGKVYGSGKDTVMDADVNDTLEFKKSGIEQIKFSQSKKNLVITYSDVNDVLGETKENTVTIKNYFKQKAENRVKNIVALDADGIETKYTFNDEGKIYEDGELVDLVEVLNDRAANKAAAEAKAAEDARKAAEYNDLKEDLIETQAQLDAIDNGAKDYSDFKDSVLPATKNSEYDRLVFANSSFTNCDFTQNVDDLVITYHDDKGGTSEEGTLTLKDYFKPTTTNKIDTFVDKDGNQHSITDALNGGSAPEYDSVINGTEGDDEFTPSADKELFIPNGGNDVITSADYEHNKMMLPGNIADVSYGRVKVGYDYNDDLMVFYKGGTVTLKNYFKDNGNLNTMILNGVEYNIADDITTKTLYDVRMGTSGNDEFETEYAEIFVTKGGNDVIDYYSGSGGYEEGDKIKISGTRADVTYSEDAESNLIVTYSGGTVKILNNSTGTLDFGQIKLITDDAEFDIATDMAQKSSGGGDEYTVVDGSDGSDEFTPTSDKEIFVVGGGSDTFNSVGDSTYVEGDKIQLTDTTKQSDVTYSRTVGDNDLVVDYGDNNSVTLKDYFNPAKYTPGKIVTDDAEFDIASDMATKGVTVNGTSGDNTFTPTDLKEIFDAGDGDVILSSDSYQKVKGDGIKVSTDTNVEYIVNNDNRDDLVIYDTSGGYSVTLDQYFDNNPNHYSPENIVDVYGVEYNIKSEMASKGLIVNGTSGDNEFATTYYKETFVVAGGHDTFNSNSANNEGDKIKINGTRGDDIKYSKNGNDLVINYGSKTDSVTLKGYFTTSCAHYYPDTLLDNTGVEFNIADDVALNGVIVNGTSGNDDFDPTSYKETFVVAGGNDRFGYSSDIGTENNFGDMIQIEDDINNITYSRTNSDYDTDLVINYNSGTVKFRNYVNGAYADYYPDTLKYKYADDYYDYSIKLDIAKKGVIVNGTNGNDEFNKRDSYGTTVTYVTDTKETFVVNGGDDVFYYESGGYYIGDKVQISGARADVSYSQDGDDLIISYTGGTVKFADFFNNDEMFYPAMLKTEDAEFYLAADMAKKGLQSYTIVEGSDGSDEFTPTSDKEIFVVGGGSDTFNSVGDSTYVEGDKIQLTDTTKQSDVTYSRTVGDNDLVINYGAENSVTMKGYFAEDKYTPETLITNDAEFNLASDLEAKGVTVNGTNGDNTFTPTDLKEIFVVNGGEDSFSSGSDYADDAIKLNCNKADISYSKDDSGNLIINYGSGNSVKLYNYFSYDDPAASYPQTLITNDNDDGFTILADMEAKGYYIDDSGNLCLDIQGTSGNDTYTAAKGVKETFIVAGGNDTFNGNSDNNQGDKLKISANKSDVTYSKNGEDLIIRYGSGDTVTFKNYGTGSACYYPDTLVTADDLDGFDIANDKGEKGYTIFGTSGDDEFTAANGLKETFVVAGGNDTFIFNNSGYTDDDKIKIDAYNSDVTYSKDGDDLIINYGYDGDTVTLSEYFKDGHDAKYYPQTLATNDGELNIAADMADKGCPPAYTDVPGTSGTDSFTPSADPQNFVLNGGQDTFSPDYEYGNDRIEVFGNKGDITYTRDYGVNDGTDLTIGYPASTRSVNSVTFEGYFGNSNRYPAKIKTEDGVTHSIASGMAQNGLNHLGTNGNDSFNANEGKDIYVANGGDDVISIYDSSLGYPTRLIGDTIELSGDFSNVTCNRNDDDLVISYDDGTFTLGAYYHTFEDVPASGYYNNVTLKVGDTTTTVGDIVSNSSQNALLASNNFLASLAQSTFAWQSAGTDTSMTDVTVNNPDEVNLMQIYTNNA